MEAPISQSPLTSEAPHPAVAIGAVPRPRHRRDRMLSLIALFKMTKAVLLVVVGLATLQLLRPRVAEQVQTWFGALPFTLAHRSAQQLLIWVSGLSGRRIQALGLLAFAYAGLFTVEGIGLWLGRRWAEYLTVVATSSLIPFEVYEIFRRPRPSRFLALALNVAIAVYLIYRLRQKEQGEEGSAES